MRWKDIIAESGIAEKARKRAEKAVKARKKMGDAERKKSLAAQTYQDALRSANASHTAAQSTLRTV